MCDPERGPNAYTADPIETAPGSAEEALDRLAKRLLFRMEQMGLSPDRDWGAMPEIERESYRSCVEWLLLDTTEYDALIASCLGRIDRMKFSPDQRVGVRCGLGDAAAVCDMIAKEIAGAGRPSRLRNESAAVAKRCADAIMAYYQLVRVNP